MDSWPMVARCKVAQWWGLSLEERAQIEFDWGRGHSTMGCQVHAQWEVPVWIVQHHPSLGPLAPETILVSVKYEGGL